MSGKKRPKSKKSSKKAPSVVDSAYTDEYSEVSSDAAGSYSPFDPVLEQLEKEGEDQPSGPVVRPTLLQTLGASKIYLLPSPTEKTTRAKIGFLVLFLGLLIGAVIGVGVVYAVQKNDLAAATGGGDVKNPTDSPSEFKSESPTQFPTTYPSPFPSEQPTKSPSKFPTDFPTKMTIVNPCEAVKKDGFKYCPSDTVLQGCILDGSSGKYIPDPNDIQNCLERDGREFCRCVDGKPFDADYGCVKADNVGKKCNTLGI